AIRGVRAAGVEDGPGRVGRPDRAVRGDDERRQGCGRGRVGVDLGLRPLPHGPQADAGDDVRVLDDHRNAGAGHRAGPGRADGGLQRLPKPGAVREDRLDGRCGEPRPAGRGDRGGVVRARVEGVRLPVGRHAGPDAQVPGGGRDHPRDVDRGPTDVPRPALHDRQAVQRAEGRPEAASPALDRRRWREGDAEAGRAVRRRLQHRRRRRDDPAQAGGAARPLRRGRAGLRRDHQVVGDQRPPDSGGRRPRARHSRGAGRDVLRGVRRELHRGWSRRRRGEDRAAPGGRHRLRDHVRRPGGLRAGRRPPHRPRGAAGVRL
ncbi:MAG: luciferase-like protein, partial [uncultured Thermomicrobiales bacterium]